jgi:transcriptional regulator with XRE-family HTH domain
MFAQRLKYLRKKHKLTQQQLGEKIGVSQRIVGYYETGDRFPNQETLLNISNFFGVSVDYLLNDDISQTVSRPTKEEVFESENLDLNLSEVKYKDDNNSELSYSIIVDKDKNVKILGITDEIFLDFISYLDNKDKRAFKVTVHSLNENSTLLDVDGLTIDDIRKLKVFLNDADKNK